MSDTERDMVKAICEAAGVEEIDDLSDVFHTFRQLYYQRMMLFATIVKQNKEKAWKSLRHEDGELCFGGGWFIVGIDTPEGSYTYHYEDNYFSLFDCEELECGKHWDGHTEKDVTRLLSLPSAQPVSCVDTIDALDESIKHFDDMAEECRRNANIERNDYMDMRDDAAEYRQLSIWLNELKWLRERFQSQPEYYDYSDIDPLWKSFAEENDINLTETAKQLKDAMWCGYRKGKADAQPEIIRCNDCVHYNGRPCGMVDWYNTSNDFCSRAERRTDESD